MSSIIRKERSDRRKAIRHRNRRMRKEAADRLEEKTAETAEKEVAENDC